MGCSWPWGQGQGLKEWEEVCDIVKGWGRRRKHEQGGNGRTGQGNGELAVGWGKRKAGQGLKLYGAI